MVLTVCGCHHLASYHTYKNKIYVTLIQQKTTIYMLCSKIMLCETASRVMELWNYQTKRSTIPRLRTVNHDSDRGVILP